MLRRIGLMAAPLALGLLVALVVPAAADAPVDYAAALAAAQEQGQPVLLDFFTDW
jgi:hypothetical protein